MKKNTESKQEYECEVCGASSDEPKDCCGQPMKKDTKTSSESKDKCFVEAGKYGRGVSRKIQKVQRLPVLSMKGTLISRKISSKHKERMIKTFRNRNRKTIVFNLDIPVRKERRFTMLNWSVTFLIVAIIAAFLGFGGIAGTATDIAKILFMVFLVLFVASLLLGRRMPPAA